MKIKKLRVAAAITVAGLMTTMAPFATNAFAASEPSWPSASDGPIYLVDGTNAVQYAAGTELDWTAPNGVILSAIPVPTVPADQAAQDATRLPAPTAGENKGIAFIAPQGSEKTRSAWKSYGDITDVDTTGVLFPSVWPSYLSGGAPASVKAAGGTYSMGFAYLAPGNPATSAVTKAYFTTINVDAGAGTWKFATPAASSTTTLSAPASAAVGSSVTLTATVTPATATGTVAFNEGATTLGTGTLAGGTATFSTSSLSVGSHSITATYQGDSTHTGSTSSASTVTIGAIATSISLATSAASATSGVPVTLTASVTPTTASGNVQFVEGSTTLATVALNAGSASYDLTPVVGDHSYTAKFVANGSYGASTSSAVAVTVAAPSVPNAPSESGLVTGNANGATATIASDGTVTVANLPASLDGNSCDVFVFSTPQYLGKATPASGSFSVNVGALPAGNHKIALVDSNTNVVAWASFAKTTPGQSFSKQINASIVVSTPADGEFSLTNLSGNTVNLDNPTFVNGASVSSANLGEFKVVDARTVSKPGWTLSTDVTAFTKGTDSIPASALGIAPTSVSQAGGQAVAPTLGTALISGSATYPWNFAELAPGKYSGDTHFDAGLTFTAPAGAPAGTYNSTLTLTLASK